MNTFTEIIRQSLEHLTRTVMTYLPPALAGLIILFGFWIAANLVRWALQKTFRGGKLDRFLRVSGVAAVFQLSGRFRTSEWVPSAAYVLILGAGFLTALSAFDTKLTTTITETVVFMTPKLISGGLILLAGSWLAYYLSRSALIYACNENLPRPRLLAGLVRFVVLFVAVVVTADYLNFARGVFLAAFVMVIGGSVLAFSIAAGMQLRDFFRDKAALRQQDSRESEERSAWTHL